MDARPLPFDARSRQPRPAASKSLFGSPLTPPLILSGRIAFLGGALLLAATLGAATLEAADFRTQNFLVQARTPQMARAVGEAAEKFRRDLAIQWLGRELPPWQGPCPIRVVSGPNMPAQGVTTYNRAPVRDFQMEVAGSPERILDSVLPHEVTHTILATHFGRPLPRWADEGACSTVEHPSEQQKHEQKLREFLATRRGIAMNRLFMMTEYPQDILPLYAQGYSVSRFLIEQGGQHKFIEFIGHYFSSGSWTRSVREHYGYESLGELQQYWLSWVSAGSGSVERFVKHTAAPQPDSLAQGPQSPGAQSPGAPPAPEASPSVSPGAGLLAGGPPPPPRREPQRGGADSAPPRPGSMAPAGINAVAAAEPPSASAPTAGSSSVVHPSNATASVGFARGASTPYVPPSLAESGDGWYLRRRREATDRDSSDVVHAGPATGGAATGGSFAPPEGHPPHSVSQPQPEQGAVSGSWSATPPSVWR